MDIWTGLGCYAIFETKRLRHRPFSYQDREEFWSLASQASELGFIFPSQSSREASDRLLVHDFMRHPLGIWAIEELLSERMIGCIQFEKIDSQSRSAEIRYFLHSDCWGQGLMTESLKALVALAFTKLGFKTLNLIAHEENPASQRVAEKAGFSLRYRFKGSDRYTHKMRHYVAYQMTKDDYDYE